MTSERDLSDLERDILQALNECAREMYGRDQKDGEWTHQFKERLGELGKKYDCVAWYSGPGNTEWLFDLIWTLGPGDCLQFKGLQLACEMEWKDTNEEHLTDFLKLTVVDCPLRLFVFGCKPGEEETKFKLFRERSSFSPGKRYLAIAVPRNWDKKLPHCPWTT